MFVLEYSVKSCSRPSAIMGRQKKSAKSILAGKLILANSLGLARK